MIYQVKKQYGRGVETLCENFNNLTDAKLFIEKQLANDLAISVTAVYRVYEGVDFVEEFHPNSNPTAAQSNHSQNQGSQGQTSSSNFQPTPFNTAPRPSGSPQKWVK